MNDPSEPHKEIVFTANRQVKAELDILVPVARKFTLNYHGNQEPSGHEYSITLEVLQDDELFEYAAFLPLRMTIGSGDYTDLIERCFQVLKTGFIKAKGELVIDHSDGQGEGTKRCTHLVEIHSFDAVNLLVDEEIVTEAD